MMQGLNGELALIAGGLGLAIAARLASDDAAMMTGQLVTPNGGMALVGG